jgi:hypothetical protein
MKGRSIGPALLLCPAVANLPRPLGGVLGHRPCRSMRLRRMGPAVSVGILAHMVRYDEEGAARYLAAFDRLSLALAGEGMV